VTYVSFRRGSESDFSPDSGYEENTGFPSENQEQFAKIRHYFSVFSRAFTDSFTDSAPSENAGTLAAF
jgi:hypothetical protein